MPPTSTCDTCDACDGSPDRHAPDPKTPPTVTNPKEGTLPTPDKLAYSVAETAEVLGIGRTMVFELIRTKRLPSMKIGHRRLVARADVEAFVERLRSEEVA